MENINIENANILVVEDEEPINRSLSSFFKRIVKANNVYSAKNGLEGLNIFKNNDVDIIITDLQMSEMTGQEMIKEIREIDENVLIFIISAFPVSTNEEELTSSNIHYFQKPVMLDTLVSSINSYYKK